MQRIIEQPTGEGEVFADATSLGRVHYHLSVYQQFSENKDEAIPASLEVEGRLVPLTPGEQGELFEPRRSELTLRLADGRALEFRPADRAGAIRSTGRSLYQP